MTDFRFSVWLKSPTLYLCHPYTHKHTDTHLAAFSNPFVVDVQTLFEMFYMCRTRLLCLPLPYFPDTHRHFYTPKDKDKGSGIITCEHKRVWWHPYAIPSHSESYLCLSLSWSLYLHTIIIYIFIWTSLGKVKSFDSYSIRRKKQQSPEVSVSVFEWSSTEIIISRSFDETISCLTRSLESGWSNTRT